VIATAGAGRMGRGIALALALAGHRVAVLDLKERRPGEAERLLGEARAEIESSLDFLSVSDVIDEAQRTTIADRISLHPSGAAAEEALTSAGIIFEAATETHAVKASTFAHLSRSCTADAIIASTSSTFSADELAGMVARPERFIVTHWLNPAYLVPLVEVSPATATSETTTSGMRTLLKDAGKITVLCKPSPGFIVPRIQALAMNEAARIVSEGVATAEDVDTAIRFGFGFRYAVMGLLEFIDLGGVDILYHASRHLHQALGNDRFAAPAIVEAHVAAGDLGLKTGRGFYDWSGAGDERRMDVMRRVVGLLRHMDLLPQPR
jgi:3-hydroxybutyryl-CoA dehydrogenase